MVSGRAASKLALQPELRSSAGRPPHVLTPPFGPAASEL